MKNVIIILIMLSFAVVNAAPMKVVSELFTVNPNC